MANSDIDWDYVGRLQNSASSYERAASGYDSDAKAAQDSINGINGQLAHKRDQLNKANNVKAQYGTLTNAKSNYTTALTNLANDLEKAMEDHGATSNIKQLDKGYDDKIKSSQDACNRLIEKLEGEIKALESQLATAQSNLQSAQTNAANARSSAQNCYNAIWREKNGYNN